MGNPQQELSTFAKIVDQLRNKSEDELKMLYIKLFANDLNKEWEDITKNAKLDNVPDEDIIKAIQQKRYAQ